MSNDKLDLKKENAELKDKQVRVLVHALQHASKDWAVEVCSIIMGVSDFGSFESGSAVERVVEYINKLEGSK